MPDWRAESLRVTGFTPGPWAETEEDLWTAIVGAPPEQINRRPREATASVEGSFEGARLVLAREAKRTDWIWVVNLDVPLKEVPAIGEFATASRTFLSLIKTWFKRELPLSRLAWGGVLVLPVPSKEAGYRTLRNFLPQLEIDPVGSSDLLYQINRPRISQVVANLRVNRLYKWSVASRQSMSLGLMLSGAAAEAFAGATSPGFSACRLEFDINSDFARKDPFAANELVPLLDEFVGLSAEVATRGDVP